MNKAYLACRRCGYRGEAFSWNWRCPRCGAPLYVEYMPVEPVLKGRGPWRYEGLSPLQVLPRRISLGEGGTPLVSRRVMGVNALFKLEYLNPTGSFKDRGVSAASSEALSLGAGRLVEDSSGNTGLSVAAYAAAAGLSARIYVPSSTPEGKKALMRLFGAEIVEAPDRASATRMAVGSLEPGDYYVSHLWRPWFIEGLASIAFEASEELGWRAPEAALVPVGSGSLLLGLRLGFKRLEEAGLLRGDVPRLIAVQYSGSPVLYEAFRGASVERRGEGLAEGVMVPNPPRLEELVSTVSGVVLVDDEGIKEGLKTLYGMGFAVEPTSAIVVRGIKEALGEGLIDRGEQVLVPLTGSGLKMLGRVETIIGLKRTKRTIWKKY